jgi:hypothetical protein
VFKGELLKSLLNSARGALPPAGQQCLRSKSENIREMEKLVKRNVLATALDIGDRGSCQAHATCQLSLTQSMRPALLSEKSAKLKIQRINIHNALCHKVRIRSMWTTCCPHKP